MIKKIIISILLIVSFSRANYNDLLEIYKSDFDNIDPDKTLTLLQKNKDFAISSYVALKMASYFYYQKNFTKARDFLRYVDSKAILKDDFPFYLYIQSNLNQDFEGLKKLATEFCYTYYGYKTYLQIYQTLTQTERVKAIDNCIKNKHYEKAKNLLSTLEDPDAINYLSIKLAKSKEEKINFFKNIQPSSPYYQEAFSIVANLDKDLENQYLSYLLENNYLERYKSFLTTKAKKAFYTQNYNDFLFYTELLESYTNLPEEIVWLKFLYFYKNKEQEKAKYYLNLYKKYEKDRYKTLYWQALLENSQITVLHEPLKPEEITPYLALIYYKNKMLPIIKKDRKCSLEPDSTAVLIKDLRESDYKLAYLEANYYIKTKPCERLYDIMPEVAVKCFGQNSQCSYVKPFTKLPDKDMEDVVYAVIKQESFFDPYAVSWSNAVGLTQFIPKTAKWTAQNLKVDNFDMTDLFNPKLSIDFSVWYLSRLIKMFDGELIYVFASYNSGENAVKKFLEKNNPKDLAEFIEFYPYDETRDYTKKVLRNYIIYKALGD
ncbi:MAG: lytic transglycosylase domain-containing protein [Sulfurihydrogenibium sp.]|uniref:lytic transglycosylase domain-containing protein n=1 Tax=Sulfurihydrogenibium sp. TaxID=2053621 RepID=UPI003C7E7FF2